MLVFKGITKSFFSVERTTQVFSVLNGLAHS